MKSNDEVKESKYTWNDLVIIKNQDPKQLLAPFCYQGTCKTDLFNHWLENFLTLEIETGSTIIMDNAAFHKSLKTKEIDQEYDYEKKTDDWWLPK